LEAAPFNIDPEKAPGNWVSLDMAAEVDNVPLLKYLLHQVGHPITKNHFDAGFALESACQHNSMRVSEWLEEQRLLGHFRQFASSSRSCGGIILQPCMNLALKHPNYKSLTEWLFKRGFDFDSRDLVTSNLHDIERLG
jgi:hypothetical protein